MSRPAVVKSLSRTRPAWRTAQAGPRELPGARRCPRTPAPRRGRCGPSSATRSYAVGPGVLRRGGGGRRCTRAARRAGWSSSPATRRRHASRAEGSAAARLAARVRLRDSLAFAWLGDGGGVAGVAGWPYPGAARPVQVILDADLPGSVAFGCPALSPPTHSAPTNPHPHPSTPSSSTHTPSVARGGVSAGAAGRRGRLT